jgi:chemosensory pili system protein ChpA (sensor histidine kinase/response regulator)
MVPFQRHVQRLTRLVRQAANDTGKRAELAVEGGAAELDRQVLERMVPPLEHMLRNAVVHGIEPPERRIACGKPDVGRISVSLERDGAEVVIVVADDGAGINVKLIRDKALSLGLTDAHVKLTDEEAVQLILEPGFSTAGRVTQAAGRGVGMDVVATEVKKLGGGLFIESTAGSGTRFTIRLPFTLAISQALIVRVAEEVYALPLATVEGVVRLPKSIVTRHLAKDAPPFEYGGQKYRFQQLASFVGLGAMRLPESEVRGRELHGLGHGRTGREPGDRREVARAADIGDSRHRRGDHPRRRAHRRDSGHGLPGARRMAYASDRYGSARPARSAHLCAGGG